MLSHAGADESDEKKKNFVEKKTFDYVNICGYYTTYIEFYQSKSPIIIG